MLKFSTFEPEGLGGWNFHEIMYSWVHYFVKISASKPFWFEKLKISTLDGAKLRNCRGATAKTAGVHFLIFGYFCRLGYISSYRWARVWKPRRNIINLASKSPLNTTLAPLISAPEGLRNILTLVMSWWGPTKVMIMIWAHLLIFVRCGLVILMLQAMLRNSHSSIYCPRLT